jgi:hypothetical protein
LATLLAWRPLVFVGSDFVLGLPVASAAVRARALHQPRRASRRDVAWTLSAATLILAAITWRWVETPFRDRRVIPVRTLVWSAIAATIAVAIPAMIFAFGGDAGLRTPIAGGIVSQSFMSLFSDCGVTKPTRGLGIGCLLDPANDAPPQFLVVGDSHSEAMFPAFAKISRDTGVQGRLLQHIACSPLLEVADVPTSTPDCL